MNLIYTCPCGRQFESLSVLMYSCTCEPLPVTEEQALLLAAGESTAYLETEMIKKGDTVWIKPEWQDKGDDTMQWVAIEDEDGGRVRIEPQNTSLLYPPNQVVETSMLWF